MSLPTEVRIEITRGHYTYICEWTKENSQFVEARKHRRQYPGVESTPDPAIPLTVIKVEVKSISPAGSYIYQWFEKMVESEGVWLV